MTNVSLAAPEVMSNPRKPGPESGHPCPQQYPTAHRQHQIAGHRQHKPEACPAVHVAADKNVRAPGRTIARLEPLVRLATSSFYAGLLLLSACHDSAPNKTQSAPVSRSVSLDQKRAKEPGIEAILAEAAAQPLTPLPGEGWQAMFDRKTLAGWSETRFAGRGETECAGSLMVLNMGDPLTGLNWTNDFPKINYEIALDAVRLAGSDFFCGLTVPVGDAFCSLIVGGWGGSLIGISSFDGMDASENETTKFMNFEQGKWYRIRLRVTEGRIEGWIGDEKLINVETAEKRISLRAGDIELSKPIGIATYQTTAAFRQVSFRHETSAAGPAKKQFR